MANTLSKLGSASGSRHHDTPSTHQRIVKAVELSDDARDIARDLLARQPLNDPDTEESTARHELPAIHVHVEQQHDIEPPRKQLHGALVALGIGIVTALGAALAGLVDRLRH